MIKAVIFDMDGVIVDSQPGYLEVDMKLLKDLGVDMTKEDYDSYIGTTTAYVWGAIREKFRLKQTTEELVNMERTAYLNYLQQDGNVKPMDGVKETIELLRSKGMKLAVASSSPIKVIEFTVKALKLGSYFDEIVTGDYVKRSKPEPDTFLYAAEKLGVPSNECIVIEDSNNGVIAAKRAGMKCIGYVSPHSGNQDLSSADYIVDSFYKINMDMIK